MKPEKCPSCGSTVMVIGQALTQNGRPIYPYFCGMCDAVTTQQASKAEVAAHRDKWGEPERVYTSTERRMQRGEDVSRPSRDLGPCEVCGSTENVEMHHWAPAHLFGPECDKWPVASLCRHCHAKWHRIVTPDMGKMKGAYRRHFDAAKAERRGQT